jgi:hypothetical protein
MASARTRVLLAAATFLSGILAGGAADRVIVGATAWHALGAPAWAQYSRLADLGPGLIAYPIEGIGSALLIIAAVISNHFDRAAARAVSLPLYFAVAFSVIGLLLTVKAAQIMLGLVASQSSAAVERAFDDSTFGDFIFGDSSTVPAFAALVGALSNLRQLANRRGD